MRLARVFLRVGAVCRVAPRAALARRFDCDPTWVNDDWPRRRVKLAAFWVDRHPVTNAQYLAFVEATGRSRPSWWGKAFPAEHADHPAVGVSGKDAGADAQWASKRLPTAAEWEAAGARSRARTHGMASAYRRERGRVLDLALSDPHLHFRKRFR